jgi:hypothetical protein
MLVLAGVLGVLAAAIAMSTQSVAGLYMLYVPGIGQVMLNWQAQIIAVVLSVLALLSFGLIVMVWRGSVRTKLSVVALLYVAVQFGVPVLVESVPPQISRQINFYYIQLQRGTDPEIIAYMAKESTQKFGSIKRQFDIPVDVMDVFTEEECLKIVREVWVLKELWTHWESSAAFLPFFTLGAASYLENYRYSRAAAAINPLMMERFGWIYPKLLAGLERGMGESVRYHSDHLSTAPAVPGFHIFLSNQIWQLPVARVHYDAQYDMIKTFPADAGAMLHTRRSAATRHPTY